MKMKAENINQTNYILDYFTINALNLPPWQTSLEI